MARQYPVGSRVGRYTIVEHRGSGERSITYLAQTATGEPVFLKQFKSPTVRVPWYRAYVAYQEKMKTQIERSTFCDFSYRLLEYFEYDRCYFQAFEYLQGMPLQQALEICARRPEQASGEVRLRMARMMLGGIEALHDAGIVHTDLKPENIMLLRNERGVYHKLRVIDLDVSLLLHQPAPWLQERGFFGTPGYLSPEHLRAETPEPASDMFTCGLMLWELLAQGHPYRFEDDDAYREAVLAHRAEPPRLFAQLLDLPWAHHLRGVLHDCLDPAPEKRPSAHELTGVLQGKEPTPHDRGRIPLPAIPPTEIPLPAPIPRGQEVDAAELPLAILDDELMPILEPAERGPPISAGARLVLIAGGSRSVSFGLRTEVGRATVKRLGGDSIYWSDLQCVLERDELGWYVTPRASTRHETLLNGQKINVRTQLHEGDVLAVGQSARGIIKLPLRVGSG